MKTFVAALWLAAAVPAAYGQVVFGSDASIRDGVTATGEAEVHVASDLVEIIIGVQTDNPDLAKAEKENGDVVAAVIAEAKRHGVDPAHIKTEFVTIWWGYYSGSAYQKTVGRTIVITSTDIASFESLFPALIKAGANHVHRVRFMTSQLRRHRDEARTFACKAAREKAQLLAKNLGRTLGEARAIAESPTDDWWSSYGSWWGGGPAQGQNVVQSSAAPVSEESGTAPRQITVRARVTVTFDLR